MSLWWSSSSSSPACYGWGFSKETFISTKHLNDTFGMESPARYAKTNVIKEAASQSFSPWLCELTGAGGDLSKEQQADTTKERSSPHRYPVKSFLSFSLSQAISEHLHTRVTWQARWLQDKTPACDHQASAARIPPLLPQPVSICSSNLTCLLTHRRLCWIENRGA